VAVKWLGAAEAANGDEDKAFGRDKSGEELPDSVADKKRRAEKIRAAKAELEVAAAMAKLALTAGRRFSTSSLSPSRPGVIVVPLGPISPERATTAVRRRHFVCLEPKK
jgi:hypothetical protein